MKTYRSVILCLLCLATAACNSRPVYFGHETSTAGMPGIENGKKVTPNVKLGKPYMVSGHIYVPRYDPNYSEEGMASWYGPGFHGGKTANGEAFNKYDYTAAHPTLPMPSIVRVTNLKNGKQVYVRVNDRGPYAEGRIIDLSRSAAEQIDLVRMGVAKVRVEYMPEETQRFVALIAHGREPSSIDLMTEVIGQTKTQYAGSAPPVDHSHWWELAPQASAAEPPQETMEAAPIENNGMTESDLPPPGSAAAAPPPVIIQPAAPPAIAPQVQLQESAPLIVHEIPADAPAPSQEVIIQPAAPPAVGAAPGYYIQLGSFAVESNALSLQARFNNMGATILQQVQIANGSPIYRVRMGPYADVQLAQDALRRAQQAGAADAKIIKP